ncbi:peroxide stress protein YaaA [Palleronia sediminis]|uniref:UPF0246 protein E2L08_11045 n=1 Tax=Palleronia sediminis TaxID=2547833 RepID=A0A4R6AB12_9RHOB|nr:peroxide stress protein YaaA [Palleronia sediminis]TDL78466.1 peroxide stress protein YaaA [Palleronia sediminis]
MLIVLSPAKRLNWDVPAKGLTEPRFAAEAETLAGHARQLSLGDLKTLMGLSDDLARLNRDRFQAMRTADPDDLRPAARAFAGDTYTGLAAETLEPDAWRWAGAHLRILSGLYGLLRPTDGIRPYRLEMGSRLKTRRGATLYAFWGDRIARALNEDAAATGARALLNCASQEYFGAVDTATLSVPVITPRFYETDRGAPRMVSFHAKRARGAMAHWVCTHRITDPDDLAGFDMGGYVHDPELSEPGAPAFARAHAA